MNTENSVKKIISEHFRINKKYINNNTVLDTDCGLDSLDKVVLIGAIEKKLNVRIPYDYAVHCDTVGDIVEYINQQPRPRTTFVGRAYQCIKDWRQLNKDCEALHIDVTDKYDALVRAFDSKTYTDENCTACVKILCCEDAFDYTTKLCRSFHPDNLYGGRCRNKDCAFYQRNKDYFQTKVKYEDSVGKLMNFWRNKLFDQNVR